MKAHIFRRGIRYFFGAVIILYPLLVFSTLVIFKINIRYLSILLIVLAIAYGVINKQNYRGRHPAFVYISPAILLAIGGVCFVTPFFIDSKELSEILLKIYPALADLVYLTILVTSLFIPPTLIYNFLNMFDKSLKDNLDARYLERYCRKSTLVWCVFFIIDAIIAVITALKASDLVWAVYNSGITYVLMGLIFAAQYAFVKVIESYIIHVVRKNLPEKDSAAEENHDHR